jgi:hypothetical protein
MTTYQEGDRLWVCLTDTGVDDTRKGSYVREMTRTDVFRPSDLILVLLDGAKKPTWWRIDRVSRLNALELLAEV